MMLMDLRVVVSNVLFSVFGYLGPSLNSVKAVVSEDVDSIREYMTYWVVLSIFSCVGMMLHALNFFKYYSPEMKVLFVMWLTLPRFQGAYRIYTLFLRFYFEMYERDIDEKVDEISGKIRSKLWHKLKAVCWILFISSNDSLLSNNGGSLNNVNLAMEAFQVLQNQWAMFTSGSTKGSSNGGGGGENDLSLSFAAAEEEAIPSKSVGAAPPTAEAATAAATTASQLLGRQNEVLAQFIDMLEEGFYLDVATVVTGERTHFTPCRISLMQTDGGKSGVLHIDAVGNSSRFSLDQSVDLMINDEDGTGERSSGGFLKANESSGLLESARIPLGKIQGVDEYTGEEEEEEGAILDDSIVSMHVSIDNKRSKFVVKTSDPEEGGALSIGLQMLVRREQVASRKRPHRRKY
jgi:hypothetical protein